MPAPHFFEFTGTKSPKAKWKFTKTGEDWFCFAGLWRPMSGGDGDAFMLLTTEPGPDVAPIHNRQMVVLEQPDWHAWLDLTRPEAELLSPLSSGALTSSRFVDFCGTMSGALYPPSCGGAAALAFVWWAQRLGWRDQVSAMIGTIDGR